MVDINLIVKDIVSRTHYKGTHVSEALAAFIARTMVEKDSDTFLIEGEMKEDSIRKLVEKSVTFLCQKDCPSLETMKMQLEFDISYLNYEEEIDVIENAKKKKIKDIQRSISSLQPASSNDFDTLTSIYRQIFTMLMVDTEAENKNDRSIEREVAAALESVFPRIGLKTFISLAVQDKQAQLNELLNIVQGIRLFNRYSGKGGSDIELTVEQIKKESTNLSDSLHQEINKANELCSQYTDLLIHAHHYHPGHISRERIDRWQEELENRRQYLSYLHSLQEDISVSKVRIDSIKKKYDEEIERAHTLVGSHTSVAKEKVYPMFEHLSEIWREFEHEYKVLVARHHSYDLLLTFQQSIKVTITNHDSEWLREVKENDGTPSSEDLFAEGAEVLTPAILDQNQRRSFIRINKSREQKEEESKEDTQERSDKAVRLSIESTPEFMQLPLEFHGYCPWTIVERKGLLFPGDPAIGVVRYQNAYCVFVNDRALQAFLDNPSKYISGVISLAMMRPQLIQLLRMQDMFPEVSLANLIHYHDLSVREANQSHPLLSVAPKKKVDASTSTPTHFIEKNIDANYEWNEWALRRRALKIVNLRKCQTVSSQTVLSNFRKEMDSQVYLGMTHGTQTAMDRGTNPKKTVRYLAGLRGENKKQLFEYTQQNTEDVEDSRPAIITYTYDV